MVSDLTVIKHNHSKSKYPRTRARNNVAASPGSIHQPINITKRACNNGPTFIVIAHEYLETTTVECCTKRQTKKARDVCIFQKMLFLPDFWQNFDPKTQNKTSWSRNLEHTYLKEEARDQAGVVSIWRSCPIHVYVGLPTYQDVRDPRSFRPLGLNLFIIFC